MEPGLRIGGGQCRLECKAVRRGSVDGFGMIGGPSQKPSNPSGFEGNMKFHPENMKCARRQISSFPYFE